MPPQRRAHESTSTKHARAADAWFPAPSPLKASIALIAAVLMCYSGSLRGDFVHDDRFAIVDNADVNPALTPLTNLLVNDFWGTPISSNTSHKSFRPLTTATFRLDYATAGLTAWWFHAVNIVLHATVTLLYYHTCTIILTDDQRHLAFLSALLFATHPIHVEAVREYRFTPIGITSS